jgi:hypothetical protein
MFCIMIVLPTRGGATIRQRWTLAERRDDVDHPADRSLMVGSSISIVSRWSGYERRQIVEVHLVLDRVRGSRS